jgi:hypothetical protein
MDFRESKAAPFAMSTRITVTLPEHEHAALTALARQYDVSLSWLTRKAVTEFLKQVNKGDWPVALDFPLQGKVSHE